ncbi:hypothetical protein N4R57_13290 [Rhodobacteraceae bacterium D3-12]|nr:hypothetical protein N4R57_13290 [Rhodobacteraceae bacterium D3-12]
MKTKWISLKRLKIHEFETTVRRTHPDERQWLRLLGVLGELENKAITQVGKSATSLFIAYLLLTSLRTENALSVSVYEIEASVPVAYFLSAIGLLILMFAMRINHLSVVMSLRIKHGNKIILPGFSVEVLRMLKAQSDNAMGIPLFLNSFIKEKFPISRLLSLALMVTMLSISVPYFVFIGYVLLEQCAITIDSKFSFLERASCGFGAITVVIASLYILLFHLPLPIKKNTHSIRWGVLHNLAPIGGHPRIREWLDEDQ